MVGLPPDAEAVQGGDRLRRVGRCARRTGRRFPRRRPRRSCRRGRWKGRPGGRRAGRRRRWPDWFCGWRARRAARAARGLGTPGWGCHGAPTAVAVAVAGLASAGAAAGAVLATATRHNRFLAGGLAALAGLGAAVLAAALAPALGRALTRRAAGEEPVPAPGPAAWLLAPLLAAGAGLFVVFSVSGTRAPLAGPGLFRTAASASLAVVWLPAGLLAAGRLRWWVRARWVPVLAVVLYGAAGAVALAVTWNDNLRFAPWVEIGVALAGGLVALASLGPPSWRSTERWSDLVGGCRSGRRRGRRVLAGIRIGTGAQGGHGAGRFRGAAVGVGTAPPRLRRRWVCAGARGRRL